MHCASHRCRLVFSLLLFAASTQWAAEPVRPTPTPMPRQPVESKVVLPTVNEAGGAVRQFPAEGYRVVLDLKSQVVSLDVPKDLSWRSPGELREGDVVTLTRTSNLKVGSKVEASLAKDRLLSVTKADKEWVAVAVVENGRKVSGWVPKADLKFNAEEPRISPTLIGLTNGRFVPAAVLVQKAKQFDDGLYAAADLAAQQGAGDFAGKVQLLKHLAQAVAGPGEVDDAALTILAAARLGGVPTKTPSELDRRLTAKVSAFQGDALRSKPIGFYTWSPELGRIFQQDRMLQSQLKGAHGIAAIARSLAGDAPSRATYEGYLNLVSRLTNPLAHDDLRPTLATLDAGKFAQPERPAHFFPPSRAHETELVKKLYGNKPIPDGFNLMDELIRRIRSGDVDLKPSEQSGWYNHQTWAQEPLVIPEKMPEASHLRMNEEYKKHLVELFKGVLALTRETHIKQLEVPAPGAAAPERDRKLEIYVRPELCVEPLAESYLRRAMSYRFVRGVLEETFGTEALASMQRQTANGPVEMKLSDELREMEALFHGAYVASRLELGIAPDAVASAGLGQGDQADAARFLRWGANLDLDVDLAQDARMMVPVYFDVGRQLTKAWVFLGWSQQSVHCSYAAHPSVRVLNEAGEAVGPEKAEVHFVSQYESLVTPVFAEIYVKQILNRQEFRQHCDTYQVRSVILGNL